MVAPRRHGSRLRSMRIKFPFSVMAVAWSACIATASVPARADGVRPGEAAGHSYYVEFRAAENGVYGHSYLAHGRLDRLGRPATAHYADVHPTGELPSAVLGHFLPMNATTQPDPETLRLPVVSRYRLALNTQQYQHLIMAIARTRAAVQGWSILGYNCNDFIADVARSMGLRAPNPLTRPYHFIPELRRMNRAAHSPARTVLFRRAIPVAARQTTLVR